MGEGTTVQGNINTEGNIRVGGKLGGEVRSKGKVVVGAEGVVEGSVVAASADIAGEVEGDIQVEHLLTIRSSGVIQGSIQTKKLIVEDGAVFKGECIMQTQPKKAKHSS